MTKRQCNRDCAQSASHVRCVTCHVSVDPAFAKKVGKPSAMEQPLLDFAENVRETSRLSCQTRIRDDLEGLRVTAPESQHEVWPSRYDVRGISLSGLQPQDPGACLLA